MTIKDIRNLFRLEKENKAVKDVILRDIQNIFDNDKEENYYKPVGVNIFSSNHYIEYESKGDKNKTLSFEEYHNKIRPYLKDFINTFKKPDAWKIQSTIANYFVSSIDNDEEHAVDSKSDNIEIMNNYQADEVIKEPFDSLKNRYKNNLKSMKGSELLYHKCHQINPNVVDHIKIILIE